MAAGVTELTDANFDSEVIQSQQPVLVDVWAPWCGPCRMLTPTIEELARDNAGAVKVAKLNSDENQQVAMKYQVSALPTILVFRGGEVVKRFVGLRPKSELQAALDEVK